MRLDDDACHRRLVAHDHGILATIHPRRGVDAVPVCFATTATHLVVPIDEVKPKRTTDLQRTANLEHDPRATLLVEGWDPLVWSQLWWVRVQLRRTELEAAHADGLAQLLRDKYVPYRDTTFAALLTFSLGPITGWAATA